MKIVTNIVKAFRTNCSDAKGLKAEARPHQPGFMQRGRKMIGVLALSALAATGAAAAPTNAEAWEGHHGYHQGWGGPSVFVPPPPFFVPPGVAVLPSPFYYAPPVVAVPSPYTSAYPYNLLAPPVL